MFIYEYEYRICYADTDQMGYMYYGNYARMFEIARVEALRTRGISYKSLEDSGVFLPVFSYECCYIRPLLYDELVTIEVKIPEPPKVKFRFEYSVFSSEKKLCTKAVVVLFFWDKKLGKPIPAVPQIMKIFN